MSGIVSGQGWTRRFTRPGMLLTGAGVALGTGVLLYYALSREAPAAWVDPEPKMQTPNVKWTEQPPMPIAPVVEIIAPQALPDMPQYFAEPQAPMQAAATFSGSTPSGAMFSRHGVAKAAASAPANAPSAAVPSDTASRGGVTYAAPRIPGHEAVVIDDLERTMKPGTRIPCTLTVAIDGNRPGDYACSIKYAVKSWGGLTTLLWPGDEITGTYQSLRIGDRRMTAASAFATTRRGNLALYVPLSGNVTDPLGRAGMPGFVSQPGWLERIGNAILSDGAGMAMQLPQAALRSQGGQGMRLDARDTEQEVSRAIDSAINQAPIFRKNQGEEIVITVTMPIHFGALRYEVAR